MTQTLELAKKAVVVTGATSGIGYESALKLYKKGALVIGVGRDEEKCHRAQQMIRECSGEGDVAYLVADLSSLVQVKQLAQDVIATLSSKGYDSIHALINNAGAFSSWMTLTPEGYELQFTVNHLAPFYLTHLLLPLLHRAEDGRVVTVSSGSHYRSRIHFKDVHLRRIYNPLTAYKQSKIANVMFTNTLNKGGYIKAYAADPGLVNTDIGKKQTTGISNFIWRIRQKKGAPACEGCNTSVHLASLPNCELGDHIYYKDCMPKAPDKYALRDDECERLWQLSCKMCGISPRQYGTLTKDPS